MNRSNVNVAGLTVDWELDNGSLNFEGGDALIMWISSSMKTFYEAIEEISGLEASELVLETAGYNQGLIVGTDVYLKLWENYEEIPTMIHNTYAAAGWGDFKVEKWEPEHHAFTVRLRNSWDCKLSMAREKKKGNNFVPAHFAGIFTALTKRNIWYSISQSQLEGHPYTVVEYFPSDITAERNIRELSRKQEKEQILQLEALVENKTRDLQNLVKRLSSPIIPVMDGIVVVPLIGSYDGDRAEELVVKTLYNLPSHRAEILILDLTGIDHDLNDHTVSLLDKIGSAASLVGTETLLVGISPELSIRITTSDIPIYKFTYFQTLQHGIKYALKKMGLEIVKVADKGTK